MTRRELLLLPCACSKLAQELHASEPQNASFPLESIPGSITPPDLFFVRDHFNEPELSLRTWRLRIEGRVARPLDLNFSDVLESPTKEVEAVLECAGNPEAGSAASNGLWEGVPLAYLLDQAGAARDAEAVLLEGSDTGRLTELTPSLPYCQIVPAGKCMRPESMLAFKLNGLFLSRRNGFPARALFPGWYGMDWVKWLRRAVVLGPNDQARAFQSSGMEKFYNRVLKQPLGEIKITRLGEIQVRSVIAWPQNNSKLPLGRHQVHGFAWTGTGLIRSVSFSSDGGRQWSPAQLESPPKPFSWVRWKISWSAAPGEHVLMSRASDEADREQPLIRDAARKDPYELNFCVPVRCSVR